MEQLSKMSAGADVRFERITSMEELSKHETLVDYEGVFYIFEVAVSDVEQVDEKCVKIYGV